MKPKQLFRQRIIKHKNINNIKKSMDSYNSWASTLLGNYCIRHHHNH
jgi:hypothetical protein